MINALEVIKLADAPLTESERHIVNQALDGIDKYIRQEAAKGHQVYHYYCFRDSFAWTVLTYPKLWKEFKTMMSKYGFDVRGIEEEIIITIKGL